MDNLARNIVKGSSKYNRSYVLSNLKTALKEEPFSLQLREYIQSLENWIIHDELGEGNFRVFSLEAGLGKTYNTYKIICNYLKDNQKIRRKFLIVKPFKNDVEECIHIIGQKLEQRKLLGITSFNWTEWMNKKEQLKNFDVLVITHQRYKDLCLNEDTRKAFCKERHTLIIDEKINFPVYSFDEAKYYDILNAIPVALHPKLFEVCEPLRMLKEKYSQLNGSNNECYRCNPVIDTELLNNFKSAVTSNLSNLRKQDKLQDVVEFLPLLEILYSNECIYNNGRISSYNQLHKLWGLKNNIILDANGTIDHLYGLSDRFFVKDESRFLNHSSSTINWINCNSSKSFIQRNHKAFFGNICNLIKAKKKDGDKVLIIVHKAFEETLLQHLQQYGLYNVGVGDSYQDESIAINHFYNLIGKNTYSHFNQCWLLGTPNIPMESHVLHWQQYLQSKLDGYELTMYSDKIEYKFREQVFEKIRVGHIVGELYQSAKRIQRNNQPKAEIFIVTKSVDIIRGVTNEMKNILEGERIDLDIGSNKKNSERKPTHSDAFVRYLNCLSPGIYPKKEIREVLGIKQANFNRCLKDYRVQDMIADKLISVHHNKIEKHRTLGTFFESN
jgi:hypothetical protein